MNDKEYKKWLRNVLKERKEGVRLAKKDIGFAEKQIVFWTKYLENSKAFLLEREQAVKDWEEGME